jgi:ribosomal protein S6--L-glutamate ligase
MYGLILVEDNLENFYKQDKNPRGVQFLLNMFKKNNIKVNFVNYKNIDIIVENDGFKFFIKNKQIPFPDFVISIIVPEPEDYHFISVKRMFEFAGVKIINSINTGMLAKDKLYTLMKVKSKLPEIKIPKTMYVGSSTSPELISELIGFPLILKPANGKGGEGVSLIENLENLDEVLTKIFSSQKNNESYIAEEAIMSSMGCDIRIVVAGGEILYTFIRRNDNDFRSNRHQGGHFEDYIPPKILENTALKVARELNLNYGSVDFLVGQKENEFFLCEINSFPGFSYILQKLDKNDEAFLLKIYDSPKIFFS